MSFSSLKVQWMLVVRIFSRNVDFFHGQLYGYQVTINSIYGFDMVTKKSLWWLNLVNFLIAIRIV